MQCLKCDYIRTSKDVAPPGACPRCGVVYKAQTPPLKNSYRFWGVLVAVIFLVQVFSSILRKTQVPEPAPIARVVVPPKKPMTESEMLERLSTLEDLEDPGSLGFQEMRILYSKLAQNNPKVSMYRQRVIELDAQISKSEAEDAAENAAYAAEQQSRKDRQASIKRQFNGWDGSHILFTPMIKSMMKNPDSYEHVETRWWEKKDYIYVETTYRGTNGFGAVVPTTSGARFTIGGKFLGLGRG